MNDYITTHNFEIIALCETWLAMSDHDDTCVNGLLPEGYNILRADKDDGRRGRGVAIIYKNNLKIKRTKSIRYSQFECLMCTLTINNLLVHLIVIYRPPTSQENQLKTKDFLTEWADFISNQTTSSAELVIMSDLNIHLDNTTHPHTHPHTRSMMQTLERSLET